MTPESFRREDSQPAVTILLTTANLMIWLITVLAGGWEQARDALVEGPGTPLLLLFGANNYAPVFIQHEYWRLISYGFLHIGLLHILFNSYALVLYGPTLEEYLGKGRFLFLYVVSAIGGAVLSSTINPGAVSAGASGAIFGMVGALWSIMKRRGAHPAAMQQLVWIVGLNFMIGLSPGSHVDNWAHGGGLVTGLVLGYVIPGRNQIRIRWSRILDAVTGLIALALIGYGVGSAGYNVYVRLLHPENAPLRSVSSAFNSFSLGVPAGWSHTSVSTWDCWISPDRLALFAQEVPPDERRKAQTLDGAAGLTRRFMQERLPPQFVNEMSVTMRERREVNGSPADLIQVYANFKEGGDAVRLIAYWLRMGDRTYAIALMTPSDLQWPDLLLERVAASFKP